VNTHRIVTSAWALIVLLALPLGSVRGAPDKRVAVVELKNSAKLTSGKVSALTELVRGEVSELLGGRYTVITKENINVLVDEQTCNDASGASCEVEMGRLLSAHYVISGQLTQLGAKLTLILKVHDTQSAKLVGVREGSAEELGRLKDRVLPRVSRGACALIDPEVASRGDVLSAELKALEREAGMKAEAEGEDDLEAQLAALERVEVERGQVVRQGSDEEYQRELKRLEQVAEEHEAHERTASREWARVEEVAQKSATKGEVAVRLFLKKYGGHRLGNPKASEAQALLEQVQRRQLEERKQRLSEAHLKAVKRAWRQARRVVLKGDEKAERALALFLNAYADHPMGNPLESEAREAFAEAQRARQARLEAEHLKRVTRDWKKAKRCVKRGDAKGEKALALFLKKYASHELGNPLESEAQSTFEEAKAERERGEREAHERQVRAEWARVARVVKGGGKPAIKAVELFLKRFKGHPMGNPLASEAEGVLESLRSGGSPGVGGGKAGIVWVKIPGGRFEMGSNKYGSEKPVHTVRVRSFYMSKTEVTVGQYRKCVEAGRCTEPDTGSYCNWGKSGREDHPINCVDWGQARTFAKWVGANVDLPTEAEWEYAARSAGRKVKYAWGNQEPSCRYAVMSDGGYGCGEERTWSVCSKKRGNTKQGLCDMSGNVWEWVLDEWHGSYSGAPSNGSQAWGDVPTCRQRCDAGSARRVSRGGSWDDDADRLRVASRDRVSPVSRRNYLGFRLRRT